MTDGNTYAINKHLDEREDWDALQEVTAELEQAEARIEELELAVRYEADLAQMALDARKELEAKLATAVEQQACANVVKHSYEKGQVTKPEDIINRTTLAAQKGQDTCSFTADVSARMAKEVEAIAHLRGVSVYEVIARARKTLRALAAQKGQDDE